MGVADGKEKFLLPGLWDMHAIHAPVSNEAELPLFIANGVLGVRVMWGGPVRFRWKEEQERGERLAPGMIVASPALFGPNPPWQGTVMVNSAAEAREIVRKSEAEGKDFIKVYSNLSREAYFAISDECKKLCLPFAGYVPDSITAEEASNARQKSIEHLIWLIDNGGILGGKLALR